MKASITYSDFEKLELRIGTILAAAAPDWSSKLLRFEVDFGDEGKRIIFSGIKAWYSPDEFVGKQFPFLINLDPKKMGPEESQGMMLMADGEDKPQLFSLPTVPAGTVIR
ncbi:hypothetical protein KBD71_04300 [Candidatus Woesebacteria bacterium]|nr:hypothetical protein [Candidatus Woesebacteria bacterium]